MQNTSSTNVRSGKLPLRTFVVFGIILLVVVGSIWWLTRSYYIRKIETADIAFLRIDSTLNNAIHFFQSNNRTFSFLIDKKLRDPSTVEKTRYWKPKADSVILLTDGLYNYINNVKEQLLIHKSFAERKSGSENQIGVKLYDSISQYAYALTKLIPSDRREQIALLPIKKTLSNFDRAKGTWAQGYLNELSVTAVITTLSKIGADAHASANIMMEYINFQSETIFDNYIEFFYPLITQNATVLLHNQTLEITAGIGSYTSLAKPRITINGFEQLVNEEGIAIYKQKITSKNSYPIPVSISFRDPNTGETKTINKNITYTVFQLPKN